MPNCSVALCEGFGWEGLATQGCASLALGY